MRDDMKKDEQLDLLNSAIKDLQSAQKKLRKLPDSTFRRLPVSTQSGEVSPKKQPINQKAEVSNELSSSLLEKLIAKVLEERKLRKGTTTK